MANPWSLPALDETKFITELIGWSAGLYEGEGTVIRYPTRKGIGNGTVSLQLTMTDKEPLHKFSDTYDQVARVLGPYKNSGPHSIKKVYTIHINSTVRCEQIIRHMWMYLSPRRKEQARRIFDGTGVDLPKD